MTVSSHLVPFVGIALMLLTIVAALMPLRWHFVAACAALILGYTTVARYGLLFPTRSSTPEINVVVVFSLELLSVGLHGTKLLIAAIGWGQRRSRLGGASALAVPLMTLTAFAAANLSATAFVSSLLIGPALIQLSLQVRYGPRYLRMCACVVVAVLIWVGVVTLVPSNGSPADFMLRQYPMAVAACGLVAHAVKAALWSVATRWPALCFMPDRSIGPVRVGEPTR